MQAVAMPYFPPERFNSCASVSVRRVPVAASGWPKPTAPPLTLTIS